MYSENRKGVNVVGICCGKVWWICGGYSRISDIWIFDAHNGEILIKSDQKVRKSLNFRRREILQKGSIYKQIYMQMTHFCIKYNSLEIRGETGKFQPCRSNKTWKTERTTVLKETPLYPKHIFWKFIKNDSKLVTKKYEKEKIKVFICFITFLYRFLISHLFICIVFFLPFFLLKGTLWRNKWKKRKVHFK